MRALNYHILVIFLLINIGLFGQGNIAPTIPKDIVLITEQDYVSQSTVVIKSLTWLINTPLEEQVDKRNELNAFVLLWLSGSPSITLNIESKALPFLENNQDLLFTFMHGMALYQMHHPLEKDKVKLHSEGLIAVARVVKMSKRKNDREVKSLLKAYRKNNVMMYAKEKLNCFH